MEWLKLSEVVVDAGDVPLDVVEDGDEPGVAAAQAPVLPEQIQGVSKISVFTQSTATHPSPTYCCKRSSKLKTKH